MNQKLASGEKVPESIVKHLLEDQEEDKLTHDAICMFVVALAFGGVPSVSLLQFSFVTDVHTLVTGNYTMVPYFHGVSSTDCTTSTRGA